MKYLPKEWHIATKNDSRFKVIQERLFELGYNWAYHGKTHKLQDPNHRYDFITTGQKQIDNDFPFYQSTLNNVKGIEITLEDLFEVEKGEEKQTEIKIPGLSHIIEILPDGGMKAGCQKIDKESLEILDQRVKEYDEGISDLFADSSTVVKIGLGQFTLYKETAAFAAITFEQWKKYIRPNISQELTY